MSKSLLLILIFYNINICYGTDNLFDAVSTLEQSLHRLKIKLTTQKDSPNSSFDSSHSSVIDDVRLLCRRVNFLEFEADQAREDNSVSYAINTNEVENDFVSETEKEDEPTITRILKPNKGLTKENKPLREKYKDSKEESRRKRFASDVCNTSIHSTQNMNKNSAVTSSVFIVGLGQINGPIISAKQKSPEKAKSSAPLNNLRKSNSDSEKFSPNENNSTKTLDYFKRETRKLKEENYELQIVIENLKEKVTQNQTEIDELRLELSTRDEKLRNFEEENETLKRYINNQNKIIFTLKAQISLFEKVIKK